MNVTQKSLYDKYRARAYIAFRRREVAAMSDVDLFREMKATLDRLEANLCAPPPSPAVQQFERVVRDAQEKHRA